MKYTLLHSTSFGWSTSRRQAIYCGAALAVAGLVLLQQVFSSTWHTAPRSTSSSVLNDSLYTRLVADDPNPVAAPFVQLYRSTHSNPISTWSAPQSDPDLKAQWPDEMRAGEEFSVTFVCTHENVTAFCPRTYRLLFDGPTLVSPKYLPATERLDDRRVRIAVTIPDPGEYHVYAWPEHDACNEWNGAPIEYHKRFVGGMPVRKTILGPAPLEDHRPCESQEILSAAGRWISKVHLNPEGLTHHSPHRDWLNSQLNRTAPIEMGDTGTLYSHFWSPYKCKIHHRTSRDWLDLLKADSIVFFGDSVIRDPFCTIFWAGVFGMPREGETCHFNSDNGPQGYHHTYACSLPWRSQAFFHQADLGPFSTKSGRYLRADGGITELHSFWAPQGDPTAIATALASLSSPPSHVFFSVALWLALRTPEAYVRTVHKGLEAIESRAPNARVLVRGSASSVQAVQCLDRIGGQRFRLEPNNIALEEMVRSRFPSFAYLDAYEITNSHPASSSDGRHWGSPGFVAGNRPQVGASEYALYDRLFAFWADSPA